MDKYSLSDVCIAKLFLCLAFSRGRVHGAPSMRRSSIARGVRRTMDDTSGSVEEESYSNEEHEDEDMEFGDVDDHQVFALLADGDVAAETSEGDVSPFAKLSKGVEFRLDLTSRITPMPLTAPAPVLAISKQQPARRTSKTRSPSLTSRKSKTRRPSEPASVGRQNSLGNSSTSSQATSPPAPSNLLNPGIPSTSSSKSSSKAATYRERIRALEEQVLAAQNDRESLVFELFRARAAVVKLERHASESAAIIRDLGHKLSAAEQSGELFARQLVKVNDSYHAKLIERDDEIAREKAELTREKEAELAQQHALFIKETELWKLEIGALTKSKLELEAQRAAADSVARGWKEQLEETLIELRELRGSAVVYKKVIEALNEWVSALMMEKEDLREIKEKVAVAVRTNDCGQQTVAEAPEEVEESPQEHNIDDDSNEPIERFHNSRLARVDDGLRVLLTAQRGLAQSVVDTRHVVASEVAQTQKLLTDLRRRANELAIHQSSRDVVLVARQNRIIQLEAQAKNDRQAVRDLEAALAKLSRVADRKGAAVSARLAEQKEHLELTLAVRRGLANELQAKKQQLIDADAKLKVVEEARRRSDAKAKQLQQQINAMQLVHARELEKAAVNRRDEAAVKKKASGSTGNNTRDASGDEQRDWSEFLKLVSAFENDFHEWMRHQ